MTIADSAQKKSKGFTLIELVLSIALLSIAVGVTSDILVTLVRGYSKNQVKNEIEQQANFVSMKLEKELRNARDATPSTGGSDSITFINSFGDTVRYQLSGSVLQRQVNSGSWESVTWNGIPGGVVVSCGGSNCFTVSNSSPRVVSLDFYFAQAQQGGRVDYAGSTSLTTTLVVRNTY